MHIARHTKIFTGAVLALLSLVFASPAAIYTNMSLMGLTFTNSMSINRVGTWETTFFISSSSNQVRFRAFYNDNSNTHYWGDLSQSSFTPPISGVAETNGSPIVMTNLLKGYYRFQFNDSSLEYQIDRVRLANFTNLMAIGSYGGTNLTGELNLTTDNIWQGRLFIPTPGASFRFYANKSSSIVWGETNQTAFTLPVSGTMESNGSPVIISNTPSGYYSFTFNDNTLAYNVQLLTRCVFTNLAVVSDNINGWNSTPNVNLIRDNTWEGDFFISSARSEFKFTYNNWSIEIGESNQTQFVPPIQSTAEKVNAYQSNIIISNAPLGRYLFTFNDTNFNYTIKLLYTNGSSVNLLQNPSFETQGSTFERARNWQWGQPDNHGGVWDDQPSGRAKRQDQNWRRHSGAWEATLCAKWGGGDQDFGGWWQEGPAQPGLLYQGSAWFWADAAWTAQSQEIKIEFYSSNLVILGYALQMLTNVSHTEWRKTSIRAIAPKETAWARFVIGMSGAGNQGALQFDDVELRAIATRDQSFNAWGAFTNDFNYTLDDWTMFTGKIVTTDARTAYAASLPNPAGVTSNGNYIRSPQFSEGVGTIRFWYRHGNPDTNTEPSDAVAFVVEKSLDGATWTSVGSVSNILSMEYVQFAQFIYEANPAYLRIMHVGGTNRLLIDDITIDEPTSLRRFMDFNDWPDEGTNMGVHTYLNWLVDTGVVSSLGSSGKMALLPGNPLVTNSVRSPLFDGYGEISFYYARWTNGNAPVKLLLETSPDDIHWTALTTISNIFNTSLQRFSQYYYTTSSLYLRLCNQTNPVAPDGLMIDEEFSGGNQPPPGWAFSSIPADVYASAANCGRRIPALKFDGAGDWITTPPLSKPTYLSFWLKGVSTSSGSRFIAEGASLGVWNNVANISPLPSSGTNYVYTLATTVTNLRFRYLKENGNAAFDDVIIKGVVLSNEPPQGLLLDDINIEYPLLDRSQDFDSWPNQSSYGNYSFHGWQAMDVIIGSSYAYAGQAARLNDSANNYIMSPMLEEGIGAISFKYRHWNGSSPTIGLQVQVSSNGTDWTVLDSLQFTNTDYATYSTLNQITNAHYVRLYHNSGEQRSLIDEIEIGYPQPPADVTLNGWITPSAPYTNDIVRLWGNALPFYGASSVSVTGYYRIGTAGTFSALSMMVTSQVNYVTASSIPSQNNGTIVQYYLACTFSGPGSSSTSPKFYPTGGSNSPAHYSIPRNKPGSVWINEINYINYFFAPDTNEYIELIGLEGTRLDGYAIELVRGTIITSSLASSYAYYPIPTNTILAGETNGYGFYLLGDTQLWAAVDQAFTNLASATPQDHLANGPDGIRIYNELGEVVYALSYKGNLPDFTYVIQDQSWATRGSVSLAGTGNEYTNFVWKLTNMTPGSANSGQILIPPPEPPEYPPEVYFVRMIMGTNITITAYGNTNAPAWTVQPYYTTNLPTSNPQWQAVSPFFSTYNDGTNVVWFDRNTNGMLFFYRILLTKP